MDEFIRAWGLPAAGVLFSVVAVIWGAISSRRFDRKYPGRNGR